MGKRIHPHPVSRHASIKAVGGWGMRRSALALWLCLEAKSERALGPGATVGVLGTGVPRLACLRPAAWLHQGHVLPTFTSKHTRYSRGERRKTSSGAVSPGWLARGGEIKARRTSRGFNDVSHDDQDQAGASAQCPCFLFGTNEASTGEELQGVGSKVCLEGG